MTTVTPTTPEASAAELLSERILQVVQKWMLSSTDHRWALRVPALDVHHVRRGLHLALQAASERLALEAGQMAGVAETDQRPTGASSSVPTARAGRARRGTASATRRRRYWGSPWT
jgi:hypothetical protein